MRHEAIRKAYPNVVTIIEDKDAYDAIGFKIDLDESKIAIALEEVKNEMESNAYKFKRAREYPPITDYLDGIVKGDTAQVQAYIDACNAVKNKYPKGVA